MSNSNLIDTVQSCSFLLQFQKEAMVDLIEEEGEIEAERIVDECLRKLLGKGIKDLSTNEQIDVRNAIKELGYDNN